MEYDRLKRAYGGFQYPKASIEVEGRDFGANKAGMRIEQARVELSSGYEASQAVLVIAGCVDTSTGEYKIKDLKPYILLGSYVLVRLGYGTSTREVFRGFISKVEFHNEEEVPCVEITAMDIKGIMMANSYAKQLKSRCYSDAVQEILQKPAYQNLLSQGMIQKLDIQATPDKARSGSQEKELKEMISESDYEFIVKAAKKYNFEFYVSLGVLHFKTARSQEDPCVTLGPGKGMAGYRIGYDITGIVRQVEIRGMEDGKGKLVASRKKLSRRISMGSHARRLIDESARIYIDSTLRTREEAADRLEYLVSSTEYRFGHMECECVGIPELLPGRFLEIEGLSKPADNRFYLEGVSHVIDRSRGYRCFLSGSASQIKN